MESPTAGRSQGNGSDPWILRVIWGTFWHHVLTKITYANWVLGRLQKPIFLLVILDLK